MGVLREIRIELSWVIFGSGILLAFIAAANYLPQFSAWVKANAPALQSIVEGLGVWIFWVAVAGITIVVGGGWYFIDTLRKEHEFNVLIDTTSKETFLRNRKRLEYLGYWVLPSSYERKLIKKKHELKIKD